MTVRRPALPFRSVRTLVRPATACGLALGLTLGSWAGPALAATSNGGNGASNGGNGASNGGDSVSSLQAQAQELAGEIAADGRALDELANSYQAAQLNYSRLSARQAALRKSMAAAAASVAAARRALKEQALLAYLAGGAPIIDQLPGRPGLDPSLTVSYAEIIAGGQKNAEQVYKSTLEAEAHQKAQLDANARQVAATVASLHSDAQQAAATLTARQKALSEVKGRMAVEVAKVQAAQQAAQQAREKAALAAKGQLPAAVTTQAATPSGSGSGQGTTAPGRGGATPSSGASQTTQPSQPTQTSPPASTPRSTTPPTAPPTTAPPSTGSSGGTPAQAPGVNAVLSYAHAQIGKPYQWGGAGPDSFDCSGLVMMAWEQAGIYFPHLAQDQYNLTARIPLSALIPGDLVFFGTPDNVYHVGIYIGNGDMIDAPETGQDVQIQSIYWDSLLGGGRVTTSS